MANELNGISIVRSPDCSDLYVDEAVTFEMANGTVRISLSSVQMVEAAAPSPLQHVIVSRLVIPIGSAQRLALDLYNYLKSHGLDPAPAPDDPAAVN